MIAIEMSGDFSCREFAANQIELSRMIKTAKAWLFARGYREFVYESRESIAAYSRNGGRVLIATSPTSPAGVRT